MITPVIIDILTVALLAGFAIYGARRGLFRALAGLLAVIVALVGAGMISRAVSASAAKALTPMVTRRIEARLDEALEEREAPEEEEPSTAGELLALLGLDQDVRTTLADRSEEMARDAGMTIVSAVVESVAQSVLGAVLFALAFALLLAALHLLIRAMDHVLKLPGLRLLNSLGGGAAGAAEGALLLFLAVWVLRHLGVSFDTETVAATYVARFFTVNTPISALAAFQ